MFFRLILAALLVASGSLRQEAGINFEKGLSWQQIVAKAKQEQKSIFVECYATWCGPCKEMERTVFSSGEVGNTFNERFISVRVQVDTTTIDNSEIKEWYRDAQQMQSRYQVNALPSYLFFSPEGEILHRDLGVMSPEQFKALAFAALDTSRQYYTLLHQLGKNVLDSSKLVYLNSMADRLGQDSVATTVASEYIFRFLENIDTKNLLSKGNLDFVRAHYKAVNSQLKTFKAIKVNQHIVDSIEGKGFVQAITDYIINKEEIAPLHNAASSPSPDWPKLFAQIRAKYDSVSAARAITQSKVRWYKKTSDWARYTANLVLQTRQFLDEKPEPGFASFIRLNNAAWEIFTRSNVKAQLREAIQWMDIAIPMESVPSGIMQDTKANLLYKLGQRKEAIQMEEQAVSMSKNDPGMRQTLNKMVQGQNTW